MKNSRLAIILGIVFLDMLGFSLILPLLPYFAAQFGADATQIGLLVATYAAGQIIGVPLLSRLSDRIGRRPVLLLSILGTAIGFLMLGLARSLWVLFISRLVDGLTGASTSVAQGYISDVTSEDDRAKGLGLVGAAFGLGFIIGPAVGGLLSRWGYAVPAFAAAVLAAINMLAVLAMLPESLQGEARAALASRPRPPFTFRAMLQALRRPQTGPLLNIRLFFGLAFSMFQTIFPLYAQYRLGLEAQDTGLVLTYVGVLVVLVQGLAVGWLTRLIPETRLIVLASGLMALGLLGWGFTPNVAVLLLVLAPLALAGGVLSTVIGSALTKAAGNQEVGGVLGLSAALESLTRMVSPSLGGFLLQRVGAWAPGLLGALIMTWLSVFSWRNLESRRAFLGVQKATLG